MGFAEFVRVGFLGLAALGLLGDSSALGQSATPPNQGQGKASTQVSLPETQWNLIELSGSPVEMLGSKRQPYIYLQAEGDRLSGSDGCNRVLGSYDLSGSSVQFHSVARTLMACRDSFDRAEEFVEALKLATGFQISENTLVLKADDRVLARFQARQK